ncbi:MAG: type II toxin-antitoxin system Phd/YefM family antitoxin [Blastocatellia bacterium]
MSAKITIEEAQAHLAEVISRLTPGEELIIVQDEQPVARLTAERPPGRKPRQAGTARGKLIIHSEDGYHLRDFEEYMR